MVLQLTLKRTDNCSLLADVYEGKYCWFAASKVTLETTACERPLGFSGFICHSHRSPTSWSRASEWSTPALWIGRHHRHRTTPRPYCKMLWENINTTTTYNRYWRRASQIRDLIIFHSSLNISQVT